MLYWQADSGTYASPMYQCAWLDRLRVLPQLQLLADRRQTDLRSQPICAAMQTSNNNNNNNKSYISASKSFLSVVQQTASASNLRVPRYHRHHHHHNQLQQSRVLLPTAVRRETLRYLQNFLMFVAEFNKPSTANSNNSIEIAMRLCW